MLRNMEPTIHETRRKAKKNHEKAGEKKSKDKTRQGYRTDVTYRQPPHAADRKKKLQSSTRNNYKQRTLTLGPIEISRIRNRSASKLPIAPFLLPSCPVFTAAFMGSVTGSCNDLFSLLIEKRGVLQPPETAGRPPSLFGILFLGILFLLLLLVVVRRAIMKIGAATLWAIPVKGEGDGHRKGKMFTLLSKRECVSLALTELLHV
ncbi:hypothetical protein CEXT_656461 [Caerostris extrusa]|uniref:Uncharacterized protein n=1 Tax=Caerostris extrusa TaxID=172846 RepID=A0AAV4UH14_CAEEX|nr:hypothetical protein CEXT_656461 [Caerostris extrusa]